MAEYRLGKLQLEDEVNITDNCSSIVEPSIGRLEVLLDLVITVQGKIIILKEESNVCKLL